MDDSHSLGSLSSWSSFVRIWEKHEDAGGDNTVVIYVGRFSVWTVGVTVTSLLVSFALAIALHELPSSGANLTLPMVSEVTNTDPSRMITTLTLLPAGSFSLASTLLLYLKLDQSLRSGHSQDLPVIREKSKRLSVNATAAVAQLLAYVFIFGAISVPLDDYKRGHSIAATIGFVLLKTWCALSHVLVTYLIPSHNKAVTLEHRTVIPLHDSSGLYALRVGTLLIMLLSILVLGLVQFLFVCGVPGVQSPSIEFTLLPISEYVFLFAASVYLILLSWTMRNLRLVVSDSK